MAKLRKKTMADELPPIVAGAFVTGLLMYPVDVVRAVCMANPGQSPSASLRWFVQENGMMGFLRQGLAAEVSRATLGRGLKFSALNPVHTSIFGKDFQKGSTVTKGIVGSLSTIGEIIACSPFENVKLAAQLAKDPALKIEQARFRTSFDIAKYLIQERGVASLWTGYAGMQMRQMLWSGVYFGTVDHARGFAQDKLPFFPKWLNNLIGGFACGSFAALFSCPPDVSRTTFQKSQLAIAFKPQSSSSNLKMGFWDVTGGDFKAIIRQGRAVCASPAGVAGLWAGIGPKMAYLGGGGAILAWVMPLFKEWWFAYQGIDPSL